MKRGVTLNLHCIYPSDGMGDSPGQWFVADWREIGNASQEFGKQRVANYRSFLDVTRAAQIKLAYIGVSISELCKIASTGELPSEGGIIYCDGAHRKQYALPNAVHELSLEGPATDSHVYAAVLEVAVNRGEGTHTGTEYQQRPGSVYIVEVYFHMIAIESFFENGFRGWMQIGQPALNRLGIGEHGSE